MKKSKLILLTIMMILVLYCGAVIFVTKPNSSAYGAIFNGRSSGQGTQSESQTVTAPASEPVSVDTRAIVAEAEKAAAKQAESTVREYAAQTEENIIKAIEDKLPALVDQAVKKAVEEQNIPQQIADKVTEEIESRQYEFASMLYKTYKESLVDELSTEVIDRAKEEEEAAEANAEAESVAESEAAASEPEDPSAGISKEEYDAQRKTIKDLEISSLKKKLEN